MPSQPPLSKSEVAFFGCGCFWCSEAIFARKKGVLTVTPGYAGGWEQNPSYQSVCTSKTGHAEIIRVEFNPLIVSYEALLDLFWKIHDPTSLNHQGGDNGPQYRSIILYTNQNQQETAKQSMKQAAKEYTKPIVTELQPFEIFYEAEAHHKQYYENNQSEPYCQLVIAPKIMKFST